MGLCQLVVGILVLTRTLGLCDETCFYVDNVCPNGNISFWLRTRETGFDGIEITEENLEHIPLIPNAPLVVLIHGWSGHKNYAPNPELTAAYLTHGYYNIITVDWGKIALDGCYIASAFNAPVAGRCSAQLLQQLYLRRGMHWKEATHVIGFSMGAQVAGILGYHMPNLPRITGLDPALPLFSAATSRIENRLDPTDARFVDVYHTNGGWQGRLAAVGHVDFYLNNGATQPGCHSNASCDHHRAVGVFAESINSEKGFYGESCTIEILSYLTGLSSEICPYIGQRSLLVRAGEYVSPKAQGTYKIETNYHPPFAKGLPSSIQNQMVTIL
ncbi:phospholipase A1 isoform X1 [Halyomorpha halys]|uniref:phospholipase A1 isoform X1 n=1 Tax=Halyomorpha halys TaxID=286706 RepID=UPI0006D4D0E9|nr:probable phospholipase A1 magnifin isoform X2 [Halyomorpha halys]